MKAGYKPVQLIPRLFACKGRLFDMQKMPQHICKNDWIMLFAVLFIMFMTVHTAGAALIDPEEENGGHRISMGEFVQMVAETLDAPIIQSEAGISAMRFAYKAGWIELPDKSVSVTREQAADILVIASGNVIWPQDTAPFADERDISDNYKDAVSCAVKLGLVMGDPDGLFRPKDPLTYIEAGYLMERLKNIDIISCTQLLPEKFKDLNIVYLGDNAILKSGTARRALINVPQSLLEQFAEEGWTLYLTSEPLSTYYPEHFGGVGVTDYEKKAIYVFVDASYMYSAEDTLLHEFGHYLHHTLGTQYDAEIRQAYEKEKETLAAASGRQYCTTSVREFFAEAYRLYLQKGEINGLWIYVLLNAGMF